MRECLRRKKKRKLKMWFSRLKEELKYSFLRKERIRLDFPKTLILKTQVKNLTQKDGYPNGRDLALRNMQRKRVCTLRGLKEMLK
jgi:hypothetical protein